MKRVETDHVEISELSGKLLENEVLGGPKPLTDGQRIMAFQRAVRTRGRVLQYTRDGQPIRTREQ